MPRLVGLVIALLTVAAAAGVAFYTLRSESAVGLVPINELPAGYLETAQHTLPQVKFDKVWRLANGNYEIRGKDAKGKVREVELNAQGEVVEVD
jgi:hypothetical protein